MCLIFVNALQTLKYIPGKDILPTFDTSGCSSLRRLGYQTNAQVAKKCCNLIRAHFFLNVWPTLNMHEHADPKTFESTILANWWLQKRNALLGLLGVIVFWREVALYLGTWKFGHALRFLTLPVLFYFPLPFGLNLATLQIRAWCMFLWYTNSWGAPIVGPGLLLTFTIFIHHSFQCTEPTTRVRGCVIMDLWVHAKAES